MTNFANLFFIFFIMMGTFVVHLYAFEQFEFTGVMAFLLVGMVLVVYTMYRILKSITGSGKPL